MLHCRNWNTLFFRWTLTNRKQIIRPAQTVHAGPLGFCMYCGDTEAKLTDEHIIPYWMAGGFVLKKSSCEKCATITRGFEENLAYTAFLGLRHGLNVQSRSKSLHHAQVPMTISEKGFKKQILVSPDQTPPLLVTWIFDPPELLEGQPPSNTVRTKTWSFRNLSDVIKSSNTILGTLHLQTDPINQMRLAAKIAHGMLHFQPEISGYAPLLNDVVLTGNFASFFVGSYNSNEDWEVAPRPGQSSLHSVVFEEVTVPMDNMHTYLVAKVHIFAPFGGPRFKVVTGRKAVSGAIFLKNPHQIALPISSGAEVERGRVRIDIEFRPNPKNRAKNGQQR